MKGKSIEESIDLSVTPWGDGSGVPASGKNLAVVGTDNADLLHIRIFDAVGNLVADTDETKVASEDAGVISNLKQELPGLLPPHVLTDAEKIRILAEVTLIVDRTLEAACPRRPGGSPDGRSCRDFGGPQLPS